VNLVVGASGFLGGSVARLLAQQGEPVCGLTRATSAADKVAALEGAGVKLLPGDLKDAASLRSACQGVKTVISTATAAVSRQSDDTLEGVDQDGQLALVDAAEQAGVEHFIFVSFHEHPGVFPLQEAKRTVERRLKSGRMPYTIFRPTSFMEVWLGPAVWPMLGFDFAHYRAKVAGDGSKRWNWISVFDVARFVVGAVDNPKTKGQVFELGGPDALSPLEVTKIFEQHAGHAFEVETIELDELEKMVKQASDPFQKSFASFLYSHAFGYTSDSERALAAIPLSLQSVETYAASIFRHVR
jgi:NADH dehydrogenase